MRRVLPLLLLLACLASSVPAWGTTLFVDAATGNNADSCQTEALACATLNGALDKLTSGSGHIVNICNDDDTQRMFDLAETHTAGTSGSPNIIRGFNCTSLRNIPIGTTEASRPTLSMMREVGPWTACTAGGANCTGVPAGQLSRVFFATHTTNPHNVVLVDRHLQNTSAHGFNCNYDPAEPSTHVNMKDCWHPMRASWGNINGTCAGCSGSACDACNQTCPNDLNADHEYCWDSSAGRLYMHSTSDPDTRFDLIEAMNRGQAGSFLSIEHNNWTLQDFNLVGSANSSIIVATASGQTLSGITFQRMAGRFNWRRPCEPHTNNPDCDGMGWNGGGGAIFYIDTDNTNETVTNVNYTDIVCSDSGRDCFDLSGPGTISNVTFTRVEGYNSFNHPIFQLHHMNSGETEGRRTNLVMTDIRVGHACQGIGFAGKAGIPANDTLTLSNYYAHDIMTSFSDSRRPLDAECGESSMTGIYLDSRSTVTVDRCVIARGGRYGAIQGENRSNLTLTNCTISGALLGGVTSQVSGGSITLNRSILANNGSGAATSTSHELGCSAACTDTVFGGGETTATQNRYFRTGTTTLFRRTGGGINLASWVGLANTGDTESTVGDPGFVDAANNDWNLVVDSAVDDLVATGAFCGAGLELGGLERMIGAGTPSTVDGNTWSHNLCSIRTPITVDCSLIDPCVNPAGGTCTAAIARQALNCAVSGDTTATYDISGSPVGTGDVLRFASAYGAWASAPQVGGPTGLRSKRLSVGNGTVTNTVVTPTPASCAVQDATKDDITLTWNTGGAPPMGPANNAHVGFTATKGPVGAPAAWTFSSGVLQGTTEHVFDMSGDAAHGDVIFITYDPATGTIANNNAVEPAAFTIECANNIQPPVVAPTFISGFVPDGERTAVFLNLDSGGSSPMLPASACTGFTCRRDTVSWVVSSCARVGSTDQFKLTMATSAAFDEALDCSYSQGTGNVTNQAATAELTAFTNQALDNQIDAPLPDPTLVSCVVTNAAPDVVVVTTNSQSSSPMLPATGCTGMTSTRGGTTWNQTSCARVGSTDQFSLDNVGNAVASQTVTVTYARATGNITNQAGNEIVNATITCVNQVLPIVPTMSSGRVEDNEANAVFITVDSGGSSPILPASGITGFTCTTDGSTNWVVSSGARVSDNDVIKLSMGSSLLAGQAPTCTYSQGTGNVTNQAGTAELAAATIPITNAIDPDPPPTDGTLTQTHARIGLTGCGNDPFAAGCTIVDGTQNATGKVFAGSTRQVHVSFECTVNDCETAAHVFQFCDATDVTTGDPLCDEEDPDDPNWLTITDDCTGRGVCYGEDNSVGSLTDTTSSLDNCSRMAGVVYKKGSGAVFVPVSLSAGQCALYIAVLQKSPASTPGHRTAVRLVRDGGAVFDSYSVLGVLETVTTHAVR